MISGEALIAIGVLVGLMTLLTLFVIKDCREYCKARFNEQYRGKTRVLLVDQTGRGKWKSEDTVKGWIRAKYGDYNLKYAPITGEGSFYVLSKNFVFNISVVPAVACAMLEDLGFQNISQALAKYDADYLAKRFPNKEEFDNYVKKELETQYVTDADGKTTDKVKENMWIILKDLQIQGRNVLLRMEWLTPFNVPLSIDYANWCLKLDPNAQTNKNITDGLLNINDAEWVKKIKEAKLGRPIMDYVMGLVIVIGIVIVGIYAINSQHPAAVTTTTQAVTTTLSQVITTTTQAVTTTIAEGRR